MGDGGRVTDDGWVNAAEGFRRHQRRCPLGSPPPGRRRLDVFPDYSAFPVWDYGMVSPPSLAISEDLTGQLWAWNHYWEDCSARSAHEGPHGTEVGSEWDLRGQALAERLERETGAAVVYEWPVGPHGGDPFCTAKPSCGRLTREAMALLEQHGHDISRFAQTVSGGAQGEGQADDEAPQS